MPVAFAKLIQENFLMSCQTISGNLLGTMIKNMKNFGKNPKQSKKLFVYSAVSICWVLDNNAYDRQEHETP